MSLLSDADLLELLIAAGEPVTVGGQGIYGMPSEGYAEDLGLAGTRPLLTCRTIDVGSAPDGTAVDFGGENYVVRGRQPAERAGLTKLVLELQT